MLSVVIQILLLTIFALGVLAGLVGLVHGVVARVRDHRTARQRWEDEHGDRDERSVATPPGPQNIWFGTGF